MKSCSVLRNRMLADPAFLFKIGTEVCWACLIAILIFVVPIINGRTSVFKAIQFFDCSVIYDIKFTVCYLGKSFMQYWPSWEIFDR